MRITAIPTIYNGVRFRSRLEADWAAVFDRFCLKWSYETEGYEIDGVRYLPDFWLPEDRSFLEVKGVLDDADVVKMTRLAAACDTKGIKVIYAEAPAGGDRFWALNWGWSEFKSDGEISLWRCPHCQRGSFVDMNGGWSCRLCNKYIGDTGNTIVGQYGRPGWMAR